MKKLYASLVVLAMVVSGIVIVNIFSSEAHAALRRDCDENAIIQCGGTTPAELAERYKENKPGDLPAVYQTYGLSAQEVAGAGSMAKMGEVHKDGTVTVGNETVATDALSIGRQNIFSGSTTKSIGGKTYYETPPSRSFKSETIAAFVFFDAQGQFKAAILTSCGNPVSAKPKPKPVYKCIGLAATKINRTEYTFTANASASGGATIASYTYDFGDGKRQTSLATTIPHTYEKPGTYNATLTVNVKVGSGTIPVTDTKCQTKVTVETPPPTPVYTCDSLTANRISRMEYSFNGKVTAEGGAQIINYTFDFGDDSSQTVTNPNDVRHAYAKDGSYTAKLSATVKVNGVEKPVSDEVKCVVKTTVTPEECKPGIPVGDERCNPTPAPVQPELPHTGPMEMIGGSIGLGSLVAASYYWYTSRRGLLDAWLHR